jgi:hypothetical protein
MKNVSSQPVSPAGSQNDGRIPMAEIRPYVEGRLQHYEASIKKLYEIYTPDPEGFKMQLEYLGMDMMTDANYIAKLKLQYRNLPSVDQAVEALAYFISKAQSSLWFFSKSGVRF